MAARIEKSGGILCYNTSMSNKELIWDFDTEAIERAAKMMGLKFPVKVRGKRGRRGKTTGHYRGLSLFDTAINKILDTHTHFIEVDRRLTLTTASMTIWHELAHARQCEEFVAQHGIEVGRRKYDEAYQDEDSKVRGNRKRVSKRLAQLAYSRNRYEVDAKAYEVCAEYMPLVKLNKAGRVWQERMKIVEENRKKINAALAEIAPDITIQRSNSTSA